MWVNAVCVGMVTCFIFVHLSWITKQTEAIYFCSSSFYTLMRLMNSRVRGKKSSRFTLQHLHSSQFRKSSSTKESTILDENIKGFSNLTLISKVIPSSFNWCCSFNDQTKVQTISCWCMSRIRALMRTCVSKILEKHLKEKESCSGD